MPAANNNILTLFMVSIFMARKKNYAFLIENLGTRIARLVRDVAGLGICIMGGSALYIWT